MSQYSNEINEILGVNARNEDKKIKSERAKVLAQIADDKKTRTNLVKKALATQRAKFGANGMSGNSISDTAVLKRIADETAEGMDEKIAKGEGRLGSLKTPKNRRAKNLLNILLKHLGSAL